MVYLTDRVMQWCVWHIVLCSGVWQIKSCYAMVCLTDRVMQVWLIMFAVACLTDHVCSGMFDWSCYAVVGLDSASAAHVTDQQAVLSVPLPECQGVPKWQLDREGVLEWQLDWEGELNYTGNAWMATRQGVLEWQLDRCLTTWGVLEWKLDRECLNDN